MKTLFLLTKVTTKVLRYLTLLLQDRLMMSYPLIWVRFWQAQIITTVARSVGG